MTQLYIQLDLAIIKNLVFMHEGHYWGNATKDVNHTTEEATGQVSMAEMGDIMHTAVWVFHCSFMERWQKESQCWKSLI